MNMYSGQQIEFYIIILKDRIIFFCIYIFEFICKFQFPNIRNYTCWTCRSPRTCVVISLSQTAAIFSRRWMGHGRTPGYPHSRSKLSFIFPHIVISVYIGKMRNLRMICEAFTSFKLLSTYIEEGWNCDNLKVTNA